MDNFALQVLCTAVLFFAGVLFYNFRRLRSSPVKLPPSPPKLPIIGHLHLLTDMPHHTFAKLAGKLGPIVYLQLGRVPTVVVSSADLAEKILKTYDHVFSNRPQLIAAQYLSFGCSDVTFSAYGPYWRQARKICVTELLSPKRVNSFQLVRGGEVNRMLTAVADSTRSESQLDAGQLFFNLANDILCRVAFGKRFGSGSGDGKEMDLVGVLTETQALLAGFCAGDFFPGWDWVNSVSGMKKRLMKNLDQLREVCDEIIAEHVERGEEGIGSGQEDFVDVLIRVQRRRDLEVPITDDNLKALVLDMFVAGTDTTSSTLEWTMTELIRHPEILQRTQQQIRQISSPKGKVDENDLSCFSYLKSVIKETMRLHPPVPLLVPRESIDDCVLNGYLVPAKTRVLINSYAIGHDPDSWEDPMRFDPGRFEADFRGQDFRFLPFGGGRRGCPGFSFGLATVEIALARLLFHFDWALPQGVRAEDVDMTEIFGLATRKRVSLKLVPVVNDDHGFAGDNCRE